MRRPRTLFILSVPSIRVERVLLGAPVLETIREYGDVLVVSSYLSADSLAFPDNQATWFKWVNPLSNHKWDRLLSVIANIQRMHGYWYRNRQKGMGMAYYHRNAVYAEQADGSIKKYPVLKLCFYKLLAITGYFRFSWQLTDALRGFLFRTITDLDAATKDYDQVTLIQASSWGEQDIYLAWYARRKKIRTIFIPYSTDQLYCNGFLLSKYTTVCIQGEFEKKCARVLQAIPESRLTPLGSAWFRNLDQLQQNIPDSDLIEVRLNPVKCILFAGHSSRYFSREAEYKALAYLVEAVTKGFLGNAKIIYRPVVTTEEEIQEIQQVWAHYACLEIQFPQIGIIGLFQSGARNLKKEWQEYLRQLKQVDVLVMVFLSSLVLDLAYLRKSALIFLDDQGDNLTKKRMDLVFDSAGAIFGLEGIPVVHRLEHLMPMIQQVLLEENSSKQFNFVKTSWDFCAVDFKKNLASVLI